MENDRSLFAPPPRRKLGLILTLSGSLLFHGSLVGVAALWPTHQTALEPLPPVDLEPGLPNDPQLPETPAPTGSEPEAPVMSAVEPTAEQPPVVEPDTDDMTVATPTPRPAVIRTTAPRPGMATVKANTSTSRVESNGLVGSGAGAGHTGVRWSVPRPAYPSALRLAHVQGSGSVRVTTNASGQVVSAVIVQSTGSLALDEQTCQTAKTRWSGPPNAATTVPITYQLR